MDIREVRRSNLKALMDHFFKPGSRGQQSRFGEMLGKPQNLISRLLADPKKKGSKAVGEELARDIEACLQLPRYAMDDPDLSSALKAGIKATAVDIKATPNMVSRAISAKGDDHPVSETRAGHSTDREDGHAAARMFPEYQLRDFNPRTGELIPPKDQPKSHGAVVDASERSFWFSVNGFGMSSAAPMSIAFHHGMLVLVDMALEPKSGQFVVASTGNHVVFRRFVSEVGHSYLAAINSGFETIKMDDSMRVIGVAIHAMYPRSDFEGFSKMDMGHKEFPAWF